MQGLFGTRLFTGFGPQGLSRSKRTPRMHEVTGSRPAGLRQRIRVQCGRRPGVYGMVDGDGELIYVGKAKNLRNRLLSYFRPRSRDPKAATIIRETRTIVWEWAGSEFAALLRELELIQRWQPRWNVQGQPGRRRPVYVCVGRPPAPHVFLSRQPPANLVGCYGPIRGGALAREAVRRLNDCFQLRDCPRAQVMVFADQQELFPPERSPGCLRYDIGTCLGPCAALCTRAAYHRQVDRLCAFLSGRNRMPFRQLHNDMQAASRTLAYERAGELKAQLEAIDWLDRQLSRTRRARDEHTFVYPVKNAHGGRTWYCIRGGRAVAAVPEPRTPTQRQTTASLLRLVFGSKSAPPAALAVNELDSVFLVAAWFRRHPEERRRVLAPAQALDHCRRTS